MEKSLYTLPQNMDEKIGEVNRRGQQSPLVKDKVGANQCGLFELCGLFWGLSLNLRSFVIYQKC